MTEVMAFCGEGHCGVAGQRGQVAEEAECVAEAQDTAL